MIDFGALPPEINSARMYAGPGSAPMAAAAAAWRGLAGELDAAATAYHSVTTLLVGEQWMGPASATMAAAVTPYVAWLSTTAAQAEQTASQVAAAAAAFDAAHTATVPPPMIAANRALLDTLVAGNVLGHNTPAIAATEAHYGQMWAQDAAAMYGYAGSAAAATKVTPFTAPAQATDPAGQARQGAAVGKAGGSQTQSALSELTSAMPTALQELASPLQSASSEGGAGGLAGILNGLFGADAEMGLNAEFWNTLAGTGMFNFTQVGADIAAIQAAAVGANLGLDVPPGPAVSVLTSAGAGSAGQTAAATLGGPALSAGMGQASPVGGLSVPPGWAAAAPASSGAAAVKGAGWAAAPERNSMAAVPGGMPGGAGGRGGGGFGAPRYGIKPTVMPRLVVVG